MRVPAPDLPVGYWIFMNLQACLRLTFLLSLTALAVAACAPPTPTPAPTPASPPAGVTFPGDNAVSGWTIFEKAQTYGPDNLFNLVDGQADGFFVYNFEQVAAQRYQNADGTLLNIEVWRLATPADAYGLFTLSRAGTPAAMGNEGDTDPGRRLAFWQNRYYVHVNANKKVPDAELMAFAQAIAAALPTGGERPALAARLPQKDLQANAFIFFHQELSLQNEIWLGGQNLLGLSHETDGVVGRYMLGGAPVHLLLVQYPSADKAAAGLQAIKGAQDIELIVADGNANLLGAVLGQADQAAAGELLKAALTGVQP
jgi:hypothetical protein